MEAATGQRGWPLSGRPRSDRDRRHQSSIPFVAITEADVRRAGEPDRETLRDRAAHAGPIDEDTLVYRIELHAVSPED